MFPIMSAGDDPRVLLKNREWLNGLTGLLNAGGGGGAPPASTAGGGREPFRCKIKNASGAAVGRYGILGVSGVIITKTDAEKTFWGPELQVTGVKPKKEHAGCTAHCLGPIDDGKIGQAIIPNAIQCQVDVVTATHRFASIIDDDVLKLRSGATGQFPMIPAETGTGVKWAIVFLVGVGGGMNIIHGRSVGAVSGGTITLDSIEVKNGVDPRDDPNSATETVEVDNPFEWDIDDNGLVRAEQEDDGPWTAVQAKCPA